MGMGAREMVKLVNFMLDRSCCTSQEDLSSIPSTYVKWVYNSSLGVSGVGQGRGGTQVHSQNPWPASLAKIRELQAQLETLSKYKAELGLVAHIFNPNT